MTAVLIDSNVLLDLMTEDPRWFSWSSKALANAAETLRLVINPIIYAEVSIRYSQIEDLDAALPKAMIDREPIPYEAAFLAGKAFRVGSVEGQSDLRFQTLSSVLTRPSPDTAC
jgi:predicted nucleic acid-binding protein